MTAEVRTAERLGGWEMARERESHDLSIKVRPVAVRRFAQTVACLDRLHNGPHTIPWLLTHPGAFSGLIVILALDPPPFPSFIHHFLSGIQWHLHSSRPPVLWSISLRVKIQLAIQVITP